MPRREIISGHDLQRGFPGGSSGKEPDCQYRRHKKGGFDP